MNNKPYGSKSWNFQVLFLYVRKWIGKSLHLHCGTIYSAILVKICSFKVFNSALLANFEVQSANFNSVIFVPLKNLSPINELQLSWNGIYVGGWNRYYCLKLKYNKIPKIDDRPFFKSYSVYLQHFNGLF